MPLSSRQCVEMFHLVFLRALVAKGENKSFFALKGGCNLRFFFHSTRYSEDIDLDVAVLAKSTLKNKVDRLLRSPLVMGPLKTQGIQIVETSTPNQTETTQRWKAGLRVEGLAVPLRTKIEFSRRETAGDTSFDAVGGEVLRPYALTPFLVTHYATAAAVVQKIHALAARSEPQGRDVFDLNLLLARPEAKLLVLPAHDKRWLPEAIEHAMGISFDEYSSRVVAFLDPEQRELFAGRAKWNTMQSAVVERLEALQ
jgi:predicted nucleotidyltransferase component of viral defense system